MSDIWELKINCGNDEPVINSISVPHFLLPTRGWNDWEVYKRVVCPSVRPWKLMNSRRREGPTRMSLVFFYETEVSTLFLIRNYLNFEPARAQGFMKIWGLKSKFLKSFLWFWFIFMFGHFLTRYQEKFHPFCFLLEKFVTRISFIRNVKWWLGLKIRNSKSRNF